MLNAYSLTPSCPGGAQPHFQSYAIRSGDLVLAVLGVSRPSGDFVRALDSWLVSIRAIFVWLLMYISGLDVSGGYCEFAPV